MSVDKDNLRTILKKRGLKLTGQRLAVYEVFDRYPELHMTAEDIYDKLKNDYPEVGLATVYRTLQLFLELGLIDKINLDDGFVRYEAKGNGKNLRHHHHHLICTKCGRVFAFRDDMLEALEKQVFESLGFQVTDHEVKMYGLCSDCLNSDQEDKY